MNIMNYAVITDNGGGENEIWHDVEGEEYTFPPKYLKRLQEGTFVIYHRAKKKKDGADIKGRLSEESHYFGIAQIGQVKLTPEGNYRAEILKYEKFKYPVNIHRTNGEYFEIKPFFQQGVRAITKKIYDDIIAASKIKPTPVEKKSKRNNGIKSFVTLNVIKESSAFANGKYKISFTSCGYYIYNIADKLYYELEKIKVDNVSQPIKVLMSKSGNYLIIHGNKEIGILSSTNNGVCYTSQLNEKQKTITIQM